MRNLVVPIIIYLALTLNVDASNVNLTIEQNRVVEWAYQSENTYSNPFYDVELVAEISNGDGIVVRLPAFWAGGNEWRFRFSANETGEYSFQTICNTKDRGLHDKKGTITVDPYQGNNLLYRHGTIQITADNRHFEHLDGEPFFWLADSWWHGMTTRFKWPEDFQILTADRKEKGFSVIQFAIGFPCDIEPFDPRGQNEAGDPWNEDMTTINPAYFDLADLRVQWLVKNELLPNMVGVWGYYMKWFGPEKMKKHWQYLIARYGAYPVTYTLCGEATLAYYTDLGSDWDKYKKQFRAQWSEVARYIQEIDPYDRLLTVHPGPGIHDGLPPIDDMSAIDFVMSQPGHTGFHTVPTSYRFLKRFMNQFPDKPVMNGEVCFEGMFGSALHDVQRFNFWSNIMMGTAGFSYGVEGIWQFNSEEELFGASPTGSTWGNVPWEVAYQYKGSEHLGLGRKIMLNYDFNRIEPHPEWLDGHASEENVYGPYCAGIPGELRIVFFTKLSNRYFSHITNLEENVNYTYQFIDPLTGMKYPKSDVVKDNENKWKIPKAPISQDWILVLEKK